jgi:hypothetical protein
MSSPAGEALMRLMTALEEWEEARGSAQEEALLAAWSAFRESFHVQTDRRFLDLIRLALPDHAVVRRPVDT